MKIAPSRLPEAGWQGQPNARSRCRFPSKVPNKSIRDLSRPLVPDLIRKSMTSVSAWTVKAPGGMSLSSDCGDRQSMKRFTFMPATRSQTHALASAGTLRCKIE